MASDVPTLRQVNQLRLARTTLVELTKHFFPHALLPEIVGCYVRVLLEQEEGQDKPPYRMAQICGTREGQEYTGFSFENQTATLYLDLSVPQSDMTQPVAFNSISNSAITAEEYESFLESAGAEVRPKLLPSPAVLRARWRKLKQTLLGVGLEVHEGFGVFPDHRAAERPHAVKRPRKSSAAAAGGAAAAWVGGLPPTEIACSPAAESAEGEVRELRDQLEKRMDFPRKLSLLGSDELNELRVRVEKYLQDVKEHQQELKQCKICFDKETSVVLMPCKHMVLCRSCSFQVEVCPVCKVPIEDRIMPHF